MKELIVYTDGGSRGNPGLSAYGFVILFQEHVLFEEGKAIGVTTNNVAEYTAIVQALAWIASHRELIGKISGITMRMDSLLACQQLKGIFKVKKPHLAELLSKVRVLEEKIRVKIFYQHIPRAQNAAADALVNSALDVQ